MKLQCPECGAALSAEHINIQEMVAVCLKCDNIFTLGSEEKAPAPTPQIKKKRRKLKVPEDIEIEATGNSLKLSFQGSKSYEDYPRRIFFGVLAMVMAGVMFATLTSNDRSLYAPFISSIIMSVAFYVVAAISLDTTSITVTKDKNDLKFERGPLIPFSQNTDLRKVIKIDTVQNQSLRNPNRVDNYYHIVLEMSDKQDITLLKSLPEREARYISNRIINYLQMPDIDGDEDREISTFDVDATRQESISDDSDDDMDTLGNLLR